MQIIGLAFDQTNSRTDSRSKTDEKDPLSTNAKNVCPPKCDIELNETCEACVPVNGVQLCDIDSDADTDADTDVKAKPRFKCDNSLVEYAVYIGLEPFLIDRALDDLQSYVEFNTLSSLVDYVLEFQRKIDPLSETETLKKVDSTGGVVRKKKTLTAREKMRRQRRMAGRDRNTNKCGDGGTVTPAMQALIEELEDLEDEAVCKLCIDEPSEVVLLPCGHFLMCRICAPTQFNCPMCRCTIASTVCVNFEL